ncbi:hypothetical protein ABZW11_18260 [Nonomuraea sp. NPDC004580]
MSGNPRGRVDGRRPLRVFVRSVVFFTVLVSTVAAGMTAGAIKG